MEKAIPYLTAALFILQSCSTSYQNLVSPLEANAYHYHEIPLQSDSIRKATYASMMVSIGSSMSTNDFFYSVNAAIHQSYNLGTFQAYYGAGLVAGSYRFDSYNSYTYPSNTYHPIPSKFFGAVGANGGMNIVFNFGRFEWRAMGVEATAYKEFGALLNYRKAASDSSSSVRETNSFVKSLGGTTEFLWKKRGAAVFGYKMAIGGFIIDDKNFRGVENFDRPIYFSNTLHFTKGNITAFWQLNFGSYVSGFQTGFNYRLGNSNKHAIVLRQ